MERPHWLPTDDSIETDRYSGIIRALKFRLTRNCLRTINMTHIRSVMEYYDDVWDNCSAAQANELEKLQRVFMRIITGLPVYCSLDNLYRDSGLEPLAERRRQHRLVLLFKAAILRDCPSYFHDLLPHLRHDLSVRGSRHVNTFESYPLSRSSKYLTSFFPRTTREWNELPLQCRTATTVSQFKRLIRIGPKSTCTSRTTAL